jgi:hypothetical protein
LYQAQTFVARWKRIVVEINKKPSTLEELRKLVVPRETSKFDEDDDPDILGVCPVDSDAEAE